MLWYPLFGAACRRARRCGWRLGSDYFTATAAPNTTVGYSSWNIPFGIFGFVDEYYDVTPSCPGGCMSASSPGGASLGNFSFSVGGNFRFSNVGNGSPAKQVANGIYAETLVPFAAPSGSLSMDNSSLTGALIC